MLAIVKFMVFLLVLAIVASFAVKNGDDVILHYYFGLESVPMPLFLVIFGSLVLGALISLLFAVGEQLRLRYTIRSLERKMRRMEEELYSLRNLPLTSELSEKGEAVGEGRTKPPTKEFPAEVPVRYQS
ncbi:MAG: LapA family protein [Candidatus Tectomicrobia bacterium]|uniref:LapA family protein n=1 Tax=Tectimicrobiota bacterium TaxID=2528274 RepID=A0A932GN56_UNCTE|nr:LapA family protein [Candidatus Tectomicrobia bacterium]